MRVLNVNMSLDPVSGGGTSERTYQMSRSLVRAGIECTLLTIGTNSFNEAARRLNGIKLYELKCLNERFYIPKISYRLITELVRNTDIVHLMNHWTFINALIYLSAKKLCKPYVVCPAGAMSVYGRSRHLKSLYNRFIGARIIKNADGHIAISKNEIPHFEDYGVKREKINLIPNGINPEEFLASDAHKFRRRYNLGDSPFILFMGRLNAIKGPDLLLDAFSRMQEKHRSYHLVFAGPDGGLLDTLKKKAEQKGVAERVHFIGYIGGEIKSSAYHAANLLAIPSRQEAMSIVVLEAGITATPVLLTDRCGFDEVKHIEGGKVVTADAKSLLTGLSDMLSDENRLAKMGESLRSYIQEHYTWDAIIKLYLDIYKQIIK